MIFRFSVTSIIFFCASPVSFGQVHENELAPGYYVVVGAYAETKEDIAQIYMNKLKADGYDASYGFNSTKGLFFVYLNYFTNLKDGINNMQTTRRKGVFTDAWVRVVPGDIKMPAQAEDEDLAKSPDQDSKLDSTAQIAAAPAESEIEEVSAEEAEEEIIQHDPMTLGNTEVFLSLFNATNNRIINGEIEVIDTERSRSIQKVEGNDYITLPDPKSTSGQLTFIAEVFGYRKIQHEINYKIPLSDTVKSYVDLIGTTFVIYFDMVRYRPGDIATLYQVYFYNDAAIMLPESKYQLGELLLLMKENPGYKIRLHGHTNGKYNGKIISPGPSQDFFALTDDVRTTMGSASQLSKMRAEVIRDYLISNDISADRVEVKAWGGKRPLYDTKGVNAKRNVRVEVEVLED